MPRHSRKAKKQAAAETISWEPIDGYFEEFYSIITPDKTSQETKRSNSRKNRD